MKTKWICLLLAGCIVHTAFGQPIISVKTLLKEMTDAASVAKWPTPSYTMKQASSYDRRSVAPDKPGCFANGDFNQFIRREEKNDRTEYVMTKADGHGAVGNLFDQSSCFTAMIS